MKKIKFIKNCLFGIVTILFLNCNNNKNQTKNENSKISIKLINETIYCASIDSSELLNRTLIYDKKELNEATNIIECKIENLSNKKILFPIDESRLEYSSLENNELIISDENLGYANTIFFNIYDDNKKAPNIYKDLNRNFDFKKSKYLDSVKNIENKKKLRIKGINKNYQYASMLSQNFIFLNPKESKIIKYKLTLPIVFESTNENNLVFGFMLKNSKKYRFNLNYISKKYLIKKNISKKTLDSLSKENIGIFDGTLISNSIPISFK